MNPKADSGPPGERLGTLDVSVPDLAVPRGCASVWEAVRRSFFVNTMCSHVYVVDAV